MKYIDNPKKYEDYLKDWIDRCLKETGRDDRFTTKWVFDKLVKDEMQAFILGQNEGIVLTEIMEYPTGLCILNGWSICGNNMKSWIANCVRDLRIFAKANGCSSLCLEGRPGWIRILEQHGEINITKESLIYVEYNK